MVEYFISKCHIGQECGGVVNFLYSESHQLKPAVTCWDKGVTVDREGEPLWNMCASN